MSDITNKEFRDYMLSEQGGWEELGDRKLKKLERIIICPWHKGDLNKEVDMSDFHEGKFLLSYGRFQLDTKYLFPSRYQQVYLQEDTFSDKGEVMSVLDIPERHFGSCILVEAGSRAR